MFLFSLELAFLETSALTGENVEEVFQKCTRSILTKIDAGIMLLILILLPMLIDTELILDTDHK